MGNRAHSLNPDFHGLSLLRHVAQNAGRNGWDTVREELLFLSVKPYSGRATPLLLAGLARSYQADRWKERVLLLAFGSHSLSKHLFP